MSTVVDDKCMWLFVCLCVCVAEKNVLVPHVWITAGGFVTKRVKHHIVATHLCDSSRHQRRSWTLTVITTDKEWERRKEGKGRTLVDSSCRPDFTASQSALSKTLWQCHCTEKGNSMNLKSALCMVQNSRYCCFWAKAALQRQNIWINLTFAPVLCACARFLGSVYVHMSTCDLFLWCWKQMHLSLVSLPWSPVKVNLLS